MQSQGYNNPSQPAPNPFQRQAELQDRGTAVGKQRHPRAARAGMLQNIPTSQLSPARAAAMPGVHRYGNHIPFSCLPG